MIGCKRSIRMVLAGALVATAVTTFAGPLHATPERSREFYTDAVGRLESGDVNAAIVQLLNALQQDPGNTDARLLLGRLRLEQGDFAAAEKELRRAYEDRPEDAREPLATALLGLQRFEDVLATISADPVAEDDELRLLRAEALLRLGRHEEAELAIAPLLDRRPFSLRAGLLAASLSIARGDLDDAEEKLAIAADVGPDSALPWVMKAQVATMRGDFNQALAHAEQALDIAPGDQTAQLMRAEILMRRGDLEAAERAVNKVLEAEPGNVPANFLLASIEAARSEFADADRVLRDIQDLVREVPQVMLLSGLVKANLGQNAQAENLLARYIAEVEEDRTARRMLANLQIRSGKHMAAQETLQPLTGGEARDMPSLELLSSAQIRAGDLQGAAATLERILGLAQGPERQRAQTLLTVVRPGEDLPDEASQQAALALDHLRWGESDAARAEAEALAERYPDRPVVLNLLGAVLLATADDEAAQEAFERAVAIDPTFLPAISNLERLDLRAGRIEALEDRLRQRMETGPAEEQAAVSLAQLLVREERREEALDLLRDQAASRPSSTSLRIALAALARESGQSELALDAADQLMRLGEAGDPAAYQAAGAVYLAEQDLDQAAAAFQHWAEALPEDPQPQLALARVRYLQGRTGDAEALLADLRERFPQSLFVNNSLVDLALERGEIDDAIAVVERLEQAAPELAALLRAKILLHEDQGEEAEALLAEAVEENPSSTLARELFLVRMRLGQEDAAIDGLTGWIAAHPDDTGNLELLSAAHIRRGEYMPALSQLERAVQLVPNDPTVLNNLSWLRFELGHAGAEQLARRAYQAAPNSAEITDTLGWILVRNGELEEGLALLREARAELQDNPDVNYHLAYALHEAGETEQAKEILSDILERPEPFTERAAAEALMERLSPS